MKLLKIFAFFIAFASLAVAVQAAPQVYNATIEDGTDKLISPKTNLENGVTEENLEDLLTEQLDGSDELLEKGQEDAEVVAETSPQNIPQVVAPVCPAVVEAKPVSAFDKVPNKTQIKELTARLKFTYQILKKYQIAYDYRMTTSKQFKQILKDLDKANKSKKLKK